MLVKVTLRFIADTGRHLRFQSWCGCLEKLAFVANVSLCTAPCVLPAIPREDGGARCLGTQAAAIGKVLRTKTRLPSSQRHGVTSHQLACLVLVERDVDCGGQESRNRPNEW